MGIILDPTCLTGEMKPITRAEDIPESWKKPACAVDDMVVEVIRENGGLFAYGIEELLTEDARESLANRSFRFVLPLDQIVIEAIRADATWDARALADLLNEHAKKMFAHSPPRLLVYGQLASPNIDLILAMLQSGRSERDSLDGEEA